VKYLFTIVTILLLSKAQAQTNVYLIPGQGADYRLFNNIDLGEGYKLIKINHCIPEKGMLLNDYAHALFDQIDSSQPFILIGTSLGGMVAVEITAFADPLNTIIISSAKGINELPGRYRFQQYIPIYKLVSGGLSKSGALLLQPLVEPDRKNNKEIFKAMLHDKDPLFYKRSIAMIMEWRRENADSLSKNIIHIHGENDHTIPIRNVTYDYKIEGGSHMITLTRGKEISELILSILES